MTQDRKDGEEPRTQSPGPLRPSPSVPLMLGFWRPMVVVAIMAAILGGCGCSWLRQVRKEAVLREQLAVLNGALTQFTNDTGRAPDSVSDLLLRGYLKELPVDPFTGRNDTWQLTASENSGMPTVQIHSGSEATSSAGTPYGQW